MLVLGSDQIPITIHAFEAQNPKALVICVHGMAEHSRRYNDFASFLAKSGYTVLTYDHRGHGDSLLHEEIKGYLGKDGFNKMVTDLEKIVTLAKQNYPDTRCILFGHSMGSFVVQRYIQVNDDVDGVILMGSGYRPKGLIGGLLLAKLLVWFGKGKEKASLIDGQLMKTYNKTFQPQRTKFDWLSRDTDEVDRYINDPNCGFMMTNQFFLDFFKGIRTVGQAKNIANIRKNLPILLISGLDDPVGEMGTKIQRLGIQYQKVTKHVDIKLYKSARHELLHEHNKDEVSQDLLDWLEKNR